MTSAPEIPIQITKFMYIMKIKFKEKEAEARDERREKEMRGILMCLEANTSIWMPGAAGSCLQ